MIAIENNWFDAIAEADVLENWTNGQKIALTAGVLFMGMSCCVFTAAGGYFLSQGGLEKLREGGERHTASAADVETVARFLPADAAGYIWAENLEGGLRTMRDGFEGLERADSGGEIAEDIAEARQKVTEELNIDLSDASTWDNTGLDLGAPFAFTIFGPGEGENASPSRGVAIVAKVDDESIFERWVAGSKEVSEESIDGQAYRSIEEPPFVWAYRDGAVIMGAGEAETAEASRELVDESLAAREADETVQDDPNFEQFRQVVAAEDGLAMYSSRDGQLLDSFFQGFRQGAGSLGPNGEATLRKVRRELTGAAVGLKADGPTSGRVRAWAGLTDEGREFAEQVTTATHEYDWSWIATDRTASAIRLATRPTKILQTIKANMSEEELAKYEEGREKIKKAAGGKFDLEADFVEALTGQVGLFWYESGEGVNLVQLMDSNPMGALQQARFAVGLQFRDAASLEKFLTTVNDGLQKAGMPQATRKPLKDSKGGTVDGGFVYSASVPMAPRVYQVDDLLGVVSSSIAPSSVASMFRAAEPEFSGFAQDFVAREHVNGLYMNAERLETVIGSESVAEVGALAELAVYGYVDEDGAWLETDWKLRAGEAK